MTFLLHALAGAATSSYDMNKPVGWGTVNTTITGGTGGTCVTVTTADDLETYLKKSGKYEIYVKGAIEVSSMISVVVTDKSIYGLPGSYLYNTNRTQSGSGILYFKSGSNNIIMRNMTFKSAGAYDVDGNDNFCIDKTTNIWVDHCDFQDGVDGNFDCKNASDYVCVTWCRFRYLLAPKAGGSGGTDDHRFTDLWGSSDSKTTDTGHLNTTFMFCWWDEGCVERMPRVRYGKIHILNCLYNSSVSSYCIGTGNNSSIYAERTAFIGVQDPYKDYSSSSAPGYLTFDDCLFTSCKTKNGNCKGTGNAFTPSTYYDLTGIDVSLVESVVSNSTNGAGATLTVEECKGVITDGSDSGNTETTTTATLTKTGVGSSSQEVELGNAIVDFGYTMTNATGATVTGLPNGVTATVDATAGTISISGTPTEAGTFKFTVTTTGATTNATKTGTITVSEAAQTTTTATLTKTGAGSQFQTITLGNAITAFGYSMTNATGAAVTGLPDGVTATVDATAGTISISGTPTAVGSYTFTVTTTGATTNATMTGTITVAEASSVASSDILYCSPNGTGDGMTISNPTDVLTAINTIPAGGTIYLLEGTYSFSSSINIPESNSGSAGKMKTLSAYNGAKVVFDFSAMATADANRGVILQGDYWHFIGFEITKAGDNGMLLAGSNNILELMVFSKNQDTGLQISRYNSNYSDIADWPSNNTILNCTAHNNCDDATMENADGFAAKLTCGEGNVFNGCMSYNNSDDGWDLFAKEATGPIGVVTIINCIAFRNGYTEDGRGYGDCDGNGFKLGGSGVGSAHVVKNCLAFENLHCGFTDNNNPELGSLTNCTAVNNNFGGDGKPNFSTYRCTACVFTNLMSFYTNSSLSGTSDKFVGTYENGVYHNGGNYYIVSALTSVSNNEKIGTKYEGPATTDFISTSVPAMGTTDFHTAWRNADGSPNTSGYMETAAGDYCSMGYHFINTDCTKESSVEEEENKEEENKEEGDEEGGNAEVASTDMVCYFTGLTPSSTNFYSFTNASYSSSKGEATVNNVTYTDCLKMESSTNVSFTTTKTATLVIVFGSTETPSIKINGTKASTMSNVTITDNVMTITGLEAGTYLLTKEYSVNVFYIAVIYDEGTIVTTNSADINGVIDGNIYDANGRLVNKNNLKKHNVYICNGNKFCVEK